MVLVKCIAFFFALRASQIFTSRANFQPAEEIRIIHPFPSTAEPDQSANANVVNNPGQPNNASPGVGVVLARPTKHGEIGGSTGVSTNRRWHSGVTWSVLGVTVANPPHSHGSDEGVPDGDAGRSGSNVRSEPV